MLSGKVALITGGARGIGLATARLFLKNGARVSLVDISEDVGQTACKELQQEFSEGDVVFLPCDVAKKEELIRVFVKTKEAFGRLDIACNNAALDKASLGDEKLWRRMLDVNLVAVIEGTFLGVEHMSIRNGGHGGAVINVSSIGGLVPVVAAPVYCASKHGMVGFSRSMVTCADTDSVRVNCICPAYVNTRMLTDNLDVLGDKIQQLIASKGLIEPETVAERILELATDSSKVGSVMTLTADKGAVYVSLPDHNTI